MKENNFFKKIRDRDWKKLLTAKNFIIVGCMLLIGAAVLISSLVAAGNGTEAAMGEESTKILGNTVLAGGTVNNTPDNTSEPVSDTGTKVDNFFAEAMINREKTRGESMEVLNEVANNPDALPDAKENALSSIAGIVADMNSEVNIETLVKAKGFEECVAIVSGASCTVIVKTDGLDAAQTAQILEIVCEQSSATPDTTKIIQKS